MTDETRILTALGVDPSQCEKGSLTIAPFGYNQDGVRSYIVRANLMLVISKDQLIEALIETLGEEE